MIAKSKIIIAVVITLLLTLFLYLFYIKGDMKFNKKKVKFSSEDMLILQNVYPYISKEQLSVYEKMANSNASALSECLNAQDKFSCISSQALLKQNSDYCHYHFSEEDGALGEKFEKECATVVLKKIATNKIAHCQEMESDDFLNCVNAVFVAYDKKEDCQNLTAEEKVICEEMFDYNVAYFAYDRKLCDNIENEKIKTLCLKNIIAKDQDTDGDGLSDLDEINIFKTRHTFADTDNDGISDGEEINTYKTNPLKKDSDDDGYDDGLEIKKGYNPLIK